MSTYCEAPECERETRGRRFCDTHEKQMQRTGKVGPIAEKLSPRERFFKAVLAYQNADSENDAAYEAEERTLLAAARAFGEKAVGELIKQALDKARKNGVRLGRPPALERADAEALVALWGGVSQAARELQLPRRTVQRALRRGATKTGISSQVCPPTRGG